MNIKQFTSAKNGKLVAVSGASGISHSFISNLLLPAWNAKRDLYQLIVEENTELA